MDISFMAIMLKRYAKHQCHKIHETFKKEILNKMQDIAKCKQTNCWIIRFQGNSSKNIHCSLTLGPF